MLISATTIISNHRNSQRQNDEQKRTARRKSKKDTTTPRSNLPPLLDQTYGSPPSSTFRLSYGYTFGAFSKE
ncbi:hypothetical protein OIU74_012826 [Salix koriyanagi]|uniref:Uncharacterized protein n=1 Tax=Salix koriyanagi TaxID=2511006 RepID=A0A9Q0Q7L1_9ROSI|nr:hypothetical protein OIU74_012826 [Salix koriyanagi]